MNNRYSLAIIFCIIIKDLLRKGDFMLGLKLIKIVTSVDTALGFDDFAISFISLITAAIGIFVAVRVHKSKKELGEYEAKINNEFREKNQEIDEKLSKLSELQTNLSRNLDEVKDNVFNSKVLIVINLLEITNRQEENFEDISEDIYTNLVGFSLLVPDSFDNLEIFYDYISNFTFLLSVLIVNLEKVNFKHYEKVFISMDITRECLKLSNVNVPMDEEYSEKIIKEENDMDEYMENLKKEMKKIQEKLK